MESLTRRTFIAASTATSTLAPLLAAGQTHRNLLSAAFESSSLVPRDRFHPIPRAAERPAWDALPTDARAKLLQTGEKQSKSPWETLPATVFLDYARDGNRSRFETLRDRRRRRLQDLVVAECIEGKGRFMDEISNGVWLTCEESFWGVPAHLGAQRAGVGLPDVAEPIVELFAGETASLLSWTAYLLGPQLAGVSKRIPERIQLEMDRRILTPCITRDNFGWMGFHGGSLNNWTPWICSNWLTAVLLQEPVEERRRAAVTKILRCLDNWLDEYADDGGCDEGPGYWSRAGASLFDCLQLMADATNKGADTAFSLPLVREIGRYICRAHICNEWYTNFADAPAKVQPDGDLVYRYGKRVQDRQMMEHGAFSAFMTGPDAVPGDSIGRQLPALFDLEELRKAPRAQALSRDVWMPGIQVFAARTTEGSAKGLYLAAQGGHNAESHNHNDVGNFMVYADGKPAIIDVGVETYTAKTFSAKRYDIWTMQSAFHNCPTVDGVMQSAGRQFAARAVTARTDDSAAEFALNLESAYPKESGIESWRRVLRLDRGANQIELKDEWRLRNRAKVATQTLMTSCTPTKEGQGTIALAVSEGNTVRIEFDPALFQPVIEEIKIDDARLRSAWGTKLFRILLQADNLAAKGSWTVRFSQST